MAAAKSKVTNAEEIAAEARANERGKGKRSATRRDMFDSSNTHRNTESAFPGKDRQYKDGQPSLKRSALYDVDSNPPLIVHRAEDAYEPNAENEGSMRTGKYRMPVEDRLPRTKPLYGPGSPTDIMGTSEQESTGLKKGGKVKAPKKFSRGGGIEVRGKTKGRFV